MGFLQPIIALFSTALSWIQGLDLGKFNGIKEKLTSAIDIDRLQQPPEGVSAQQRNAAVGLNVEETAPVEPDADINELTEGIEFQDDNAGPQPGTQPAK